MTTGAQQLAHRREWVGGLLGLAAILAWATSAAGVLWIGRQVGVWQYLAINSLIACGGQVGFYCLLGRSPRSLFVMPPRLWALAALGFVFYSLCYVGGLVAARSDAQAVGVSLMNYLWPVLTVVGCLFLVPGSRLSARLGVALAVALLGLVVANGQEIHRARLHGAALPYLLGGLAGAAWALYSALIARWREWGQRYATAPAGFLMIGVVGAAGCLLTREWRTVDARMWLAFLYVGLVPNAAGYMLWELALHRAPATRLGLMGAAAPVLSTLCLLALFALTGQARTVPAHWATLLLGAGLVAAAVLLVSIKKEMMT
jgi:drug/metabolite transporter (DMT)-like permease